MARRPKLNSNSGNGFDSKLVKSFVDKIEDFNDQIATQKASNAKRCRDIQDKIKDVYETAREKSVPVKALKTEVKLRRLDRTKAELVEALEADDAQSLEAIRIALGDFASSPLGMAAVQAAEARQ